MNRRQGTAFYIEVIVMLLVFMIVIQTLVRVFASSRRSAFEAERLSDAVTLASNCAEIVLASDSAEEVAEVLQDAGAKGNETVISARFDDNLEMNPEGKMEVLIDWQKKEEDFSHAVITVSYSGEQLYELTTGKYLGRRSGS